MAVTLKDIALLAGVSYQAVSAVINGSGSSRVSKSTREKILRISKEVNYISNAAARSLKGAPSKTIGIMGQITSSGLNSALINEISEILIVNGYNILFSNYGTSNLNAEESLSNLLSRGVDGIIIYNSEDPKIFQSNQTVPYLFYSHNNHKFMDVGADNEYGGYLATKHLLDHGHEKVAMLTVRSHEKNHGRYIGWNRAHEEAGIKVTDDDLVVLRELDGSAKKTIEYIKKRKFTAIFATNDFIGAKFIKALNQHNLRVPEDIAVIGYDGYSFSEFCSASLTTIIQPIRSQAEFGMKLLLERIKKKELNSKPANHLIKPILYKGTSCGCKIKPLDNLYRINTFNMLEKDAKINFNLDVLN
jgi:DNA-binding LacI/PurR family transcriptional regulator